MKLLVAEDDLTSRSMLAAITQKWGYDVIATEDGEAAWQTLLKSDAPRLLLLDWEMPGINGLELCQRMRQQETNDPPYIILLTSRNETSDVVEGLEQGANDYIVKPFQTQELHARLQVGKRMLNLQNELRLLREDLAFQANYDVLTGLLNRRAIMSALEKEMARVHRTHETLYIALGDIDYFKKINDTHGHLVGDTVLKEVGKRMTSTLRPYDHIGRYGGEEFLIVLSTKDHHESYVFERLRCAIADNKFNVGDKTLDVTMSIGVASLLPDEPRHDSISLIAEADNALYQAKNAGRNRVMQSAQLETSETK